MPVRACRKNLRLDYRCIEYKALACVLAQAQPGGWTLYACSSENELHFCTSNLNPQNNN